MMSMLKHFSQSLFIGALSAFVGFASSFAVVLNGLSGVGASTQQAASGLMAASITMGLCGILLSLYYRQPISIAWSTPGAALLAICGTIEGGFSIAIGAFILCSLLIICAGLLPPFGKLVNAIPAALANAMLAGILLTLCLAPFKAIAFNPWFGLPLIIAWFIGGKINRYLAVPFALIAFIGVVKFGIAFPANWSEQLSAALVPSPLLLWPSFSWQGFFSIALPLFIVTMASQNIPGFAVLKANGYTPALSPLITTTGIFSLLSAPFGSHGINLAAITAAMLAGDEAGSNRNQRYWGAVICGIFYILFGLFAGVTVAFVSLAPQILVEAVAGLALFGAFSASALAAFRDEKHRNAACVTFLASASSISLFGVSGAFWGLIAGILMLGFEGMKNKEAKK